MECQFRSLLIDWIQTASLGVKAAPPWLWSLRTKSRETDVCSENAGAQGAPCRLQEPSLCAATSRLASRTFQNSPEVLRARLPRLIFQASGSLLAALSVFPLGFWNVSKSMSCVLFNVYRNFVNQFK